MNYYDSWEEKNGVYSRDFGKHTARVFETLDDTGAILSIYDDKGKFVKSIVIFDNIEDAMKQAKNKIEEL